MSAGEMGLELWEWPCSPSFDLPPHHPAQLVTCSSDPAEQVPVL